MYFIINIGKIEKDVNDMKDKILVKIVVPEVEFTFDVYLPINMSKSGLNLNTLVIGESGSGKGQFFIRPNIYDNPENVHAIVLVALNSKFHLEYLILVNNVKNYLE